MFNKNLITKNKKSKYLYFIKKKIEAGLSLLSWEIKSIRLKNINLDNSYIKIYKLNAYLVNYNIKSINNLNNKNKCRSIKLLLKKKELIFLFNEVNKNGYTIIPLCMYWKNNWSKLNIGLVKGKKKYDKRENIKIKEWKKKKIFLKTTCQNFINKYNF